MDNVCICVFAKPPVPGKVKTRLIPALGNNGAALLAEALLQDTLDAVAEIDWASPVLATTEESQKLPSRNFPIWLQGAGNLGEKLERVLRRALEGSKAAIAIGADSPGLPGALLDRTRELLDTHDVVLGPCTDGGFYLLALKSCPVGLLDGIPWSTPVTLERTVSRLKARGLTVALLDIWFDIDRPQDLHTLIELLMAGFIFAPRTARAVAHLWPLMPRVSR